MDGPWRNYAKRSIRQRKTNTVQFHLYVASKKQNKWTNKTKIIDKEKRMVVARGKGGWVGEMGEGGQEVKLPVIK